MQQQLMLHKRSNISMTKLEKLREGLPVKFTDLAPRAHCNCSKPIYIHSNSLDSE